MNSSFIHDPGDDAGDPRRLYALRDKNREFCISGLRFRQLSYRIAPFGTKISSERSFAALKNNKGGYRFSGSFAEPLSALFPSTLPRFPPQAVSFYSDHRKVAIYCDLSIIT